MICRKLIYTDLNKSNTEKILKQVRKLNWDDPDVTIYIVKCLKNIWNVKGMNMNSYSTINLQKFAKLT